MDETDANWKHREDLKHHDEAHGDHSNRKRDAKREAARIIVLAALLVAALLIVFPVFTRSLSRGRPSQAQNPEERIAQLESKLDALSRSSAAATGRNSPDNLAVAGLASEIKQIKADVQVMLGDNPSKTLAIPMMRRDINDMKERFRADIVAVRDESTRMLDVIKWIAGLLVTSNLGMGYLVMTKNKG
jgi:hypothetical protein